MANFPLVSNISTSNSSTSTLISGTTYTGTSEDVSLYSEMRVTVFSNVASATDGLSIQQSSDGTNWDNIDVYSVSASSSKTIVVPRQAKFFRVLYTNGATTQTTFRLQTFLNVDGTTPSSQRPSDAYSNETDMTHIWAFNSIFNGTTWDRLRSTTKSTQGSTILTTQDLKDSGRNNIILYATGAAAGTTTTETAITLTRSSGTTATSTGTSFIITSGKVFRITSIQFGSRGHATGTLQITTFNFRMNTAGAVITSSTPILLSCRSATPATTLAYDRVDVRLGEGYEITGNGTIQIGVTAAATYTSNAPTWDVFILGYEY